MGTLMTNEADLRKTFETACLHCSPGGAALFAPDYVRETFRSSVQCDGHEGRCE